VCVSIKRGSSSCVTASWLQLPWLTVECYLYVRLASIIASQVTAGSAVEVQHWQCCPSAAGGSCSSVCGKHIYGCINYRVWVCV
jgi:hypothetical protein